MAYVYIYGTTSTPCACCEGGGPACELECLMTHVSGCPTDGDCNPLTYPFETADCGPTVNGLIPCPCEEDPATLINTVKVRLNLTGLTVGVTYTATVYFTMDGDPMPTDSYSWTFEATGTSETTGWADVPDPAAEFDPGWTATSCDIVTA